MPRRTDSRERPDAPRGRPSVPTPQTKPRPLLPHGTVDSRQWSTSRWPVPRSRARPPAAPSSRRAARPPVIPSRHPSPHRAPLGVSRPHRAPITSITCLQHQTKRNTRCNIKTSILQHQNKATATKEQSYCNARYKIRKKKLMQQRNITCCDIITRLLQQK